ncbi:hypothetical protein ACKKBG_A23735 [Auxenochlorella protothecoides x Auxenochlorella symbiontica]
MDVSCLEDGDWDILGAAPSGNQAWWTSELEGDSRFPLLDLSTDAGGSASTSLCTPTLELDFSDGAPVIAMTAGLGPVDKAPPPAPATGTSGGSSNSDHQTSRPKYTAEERLERQRARNRLAQIRYRARKKAAAGAVVGHAGAVAASLQAARAEAAVLASQHSLLSGLMSVRDELIDALERAYMSQGGGGAPAPGAPRARPPPGAGCPRRAASHFTAGQLAGWHGGCTLASMDRLMALPPEQARAFSQVPSEVVARRWGDALSSMKQLIVDLEERGGKCKPLEDQLRRKMLEGRVLKWRIFQYMGDRLEQITRLLEGLGDRQWEHIVNSLGLDPEQGQQMLMVARATRGKLREIMARRKDVLQKLTASSQAAVGMPLQARSLDSLQLRALIVALEDTLEEEQGLYHLAAHAVFRNVLTGLQKAKTITLKPTYGAPDVAELLSVWEQTCGDGIQESEVPAAADPAWKWMVEVHSESNNKNINVWTAEVVEACKVQDFCSLQHLTSQVHAI